MLEAAVMWEFESAMRTVVKVKSVVFEAPLKVCACFIRWVPTEVFFFFRLGFLVQSRHYRGQLQHVAGDH
jgi:hypothetical protein